MGIKDPVLQILEVCVLTPGFASNHRGADAEVSGPGFTPSEGQLH